MNTNKICTLDLKTAVKRKFVEHDNKTSAYSVPCETSSIDAEIEEKQTFVGSRLQRPRTPNRARCLPRATTLLQNRAQRKRCLGGLETAFFCY